MKRPALLFLPVIFCVCLLSGVYAADNELVIEGPEKMAKFAGAWVERFRQDEPGAAIRFNARKAQDGFTSLSRGECGIVINAAGPQEIPGVKAKPVNKTAVAGEGVTFVVNPRNPVTKITIGELGDILSGQTINWEDLGGAFGEIVVYGPPADSWVNDFVEANILNASLPGGKKKIAYRVNNMLSNDEIQREVALNPMAMGYYPGAYASSGLKMLSVASAASGEYLAPAKDKIPDSSYILQRPIFFWTSGMDTQVKLFIERVLSQDYQGMLPAYGFYPAKANDQTKDPLKQEGLK